MNSGTRTTTSTIVFRRPVQLAALDAPLPAGSYAVDIEEELLPGLSFAAYRRVAAWLTLPPQPGGAVLTEILRLDPAELDAALARDAASP
jgi:hypothetical protein